MARIRAVKLPQWVSLAVPVLAALLGGLGIASTATAAPMEPVQSMVKKEKPAVVDTLRQLVEIESGSRDKPGLDKLATLLQERLRALGGTIEVVDGNAEVTRLYDTPPQIGNIVIARWEGTGTKRLMLMAHMDTVYPAGTLAKRPFRIDGSRAYGPGIADDKGGVAVILHGLAILRALDFRNFKTLTVMINGDEEISSPGARSLFAKVGAEQDFVISFEPTGVSKDEIALATSGIGAAMLTVRGKSAHAGVNPELGRNALVELSHQILQTRDLSDAQRRHR